MRESVSCAGGKVVLDKVSDKAFLEEVVKKGEYIRKKLAEMPEVTGVDGMGLMLGISLKTKKAGDVAGECFKRGLLVLTAKDKVRLLPPLNISYEQIDKGMEIFAGILSE